METTIGQLLINQALPKELRDYRRTLNKSAVVDLSTRLATDYPDKYPELVQKLNSIGMDASILNGGYSVGVDDLISFPEIEGQIAKIRRQATAIRANKSLSQEQKNKQLVAYLQDEQPKLMAALEARAKQSSNPLAAHTFGIGRGNLFNLNSLLGADLLYTDTDGKPVPVPVLHNYADGLSPKEYFAGSFGARKGLVDLKTSTAKAGYYNKQISTAAHRLLVTALDDDRPAAGVRGFPSSVDDSDNVGALLAKDTEGYPRNTEITPRVLKDLQAKGIKKILVRSPTVGGPEDGGVYARDAGRREKGSLPPIGDFIGISAAHSISEPVTQSQICLAAGTLVRMADWTEKPIEEVVKGDIVLFCDGVRWVTMKVRNVLYSGEQPCVETTVQISKSINTPTPEFRTTVTSKDHKFATVRGTYQAQHGPQDIHLEPIGKIAGIWRHRNPPQIVCIDPVFTYTNGNVCVVRPGWQLGTVYSQVKVGNRPCWDLELDDPHMFLLANGLLVSNSSKHSGGVAGASAGAIGGFKSINQLLQVAESFRGGATHSEEDGVVRRIYPAPQGGHYVEIGETKSYVPEDLELRVKEGDEVEAGDVISDGVPNPAKVVEHKGIGEGRRYLVDTMRSVFKASGMSPDRRNLELLARGLVNHVQATDEFDDHFPDDIVPYQVVERRWRPRKDAARLGLSSARGRYLEEPVLHYSIGTRIRPSVLRNLEEFGVTDVLTHTEPPPFQPKMIRGAMQAASDPDVLSRSLGGYQEKSTLDAVRRGATSDPQGTSFVPSLVQSQTFGQVGKVRPWPAAPSAGPPNLDIDWTDRD